MRAAGHSGGAPRRSSDAALARAMWARHARRADGTLVFDDPLVAERVGRIAVDGEAAS